MQKDAITCTVCRMMLLLYNSNIILENNIETVILGRQDIILQGIVEFEYIYIFIYLYLLCSKVTFFMMYSMEENL